MPSSSATPAWRTALAPYSKPDVRRSALDVLTSLVPYLALSVAMYFLLDVSYWLALAVALPAAGFLLRTYIVFHDCTHGSFLPTKKANSWMGMIAGLFVYSNFLSWRHSHQVHHATAGDLDRRGVGDVPTWTVAEYRDKAWYWRMAYWLFRHPLVLFGLGWIWSLIIQPRLWLPGARARIKRNVMGTNLALVLLVGGVVWAIGWKAYLLVQLPTAGIAGAAGVWLFYVQHQFEDVYWERGADWDYADAALRGSSYLRLPKVLQFFTGNIGLHHVHHLQSRIPNYNLQAAHDNTPIFHDVPVLTLWDGIKASRLKLWDEDARRLVTFAEARAPRAAAAAASV